jgi:hypothetical protein
MNELIVKYISFEISISIRNMSQRLEWILEVIIISIRNTTIECLFVSLTSLSLK